MTTKFLSTLICSLSKFYCHDVSHEQGVLGIIFLPAPFPPPPEKCEFYSYIVVSLSLNHDKLGCKLLLTRY